MMDEPSNMRLGTVLIVEDEALVSLLIEDTVREMGAEGVHVFASVEAARETAAMADLDCAILDLRLQDGSSREIADILHQRGVPFLFSTGSGPDAIPREYQDRPVVGKPFADADLRAAVLAAMASSEGTGK